MTSLRIAQVIALHDPHRAPPGSPSAGSEGRVLNLIPRATPVPGSSLCGAIRRLGLEILPYEPYRNVHGFLARKRAGGPR